MKLTVQQRSLRAALAHMERITDPYDSRDPKSGKFRPHFDPAMANVRLTAGAGRLRCEVSDGHSALRSFCKADVSDEGEVSLPFLNLHRAVEAMPDQLLRLQNEESEVRIEPVMGHRTIWLAPGDMNPKRMPDVPTIGWMPLAGELVVPALRRVMTCVSTDFERPHVNSVLFEAKAGVLAIVATDGHRLAIEEIDVNASEVDGWEWLVPLSACQVLASMLSSDTMVLVASATPHLFFKASEGRVYSVRRVDATFPPYLHAVPKEYASEAIVDREELLRAMSFAAIASPHKDDGVALCFVEGGMRVVSRSRYGSSSTFLLGPMTGPMQRLGVSVHYLIDAVRQVPTDQVRLQLPLVGNDFGNVAEPVCLSPVEAGVPRTRFRVVIMPRRMEDPEL